MHLFELRCTAYLKQDLEHLHKSYDGLSKFISFSIHKIDGYGDFHSKTGFKHYCFSNLYKPEQDGIYKKGQTYTFSIRSFDEKLIKGLGVSLRENINNPHLQVLDTKIMKKEHFFISSIYTVTPAIVTLSEQENKHKFWTPNNGDIVKLTEQLQDNLSKKYTSFYGKDLSPKQNFIQMLELKTKKPQSIYFSKTQNDKTQEVRLLGNKFSLHINEDETSQKLAFTALACGIGDRNSYAGGFCLWKK